MGLALTVLGCCGSYPGRAMACSGYLVEGGGVRLWVDAGTGTMANLQRHVSLADVDAVVLSHEHPDHWSDLEGFHVYTHFQIDRLGVPLYAPRPLKKFTYYKDMSPWLVWNDVGDGDTVSIGELSLTFSRTDHPPETLAVRIDGDGRSLGYSADTGPGWALEALGPGLDLALCEATFPKGQEGTTPGHLSSVEAGAMARDAGVGRLVLTHLWPSNDVDATARDAAEAFGRDVTVARTHDRFEV